MHISIHSFRRKRTLVAAFLILLLTAAAQEPGDTYTMLQEGFHRPPDSARPRTWWHWTNGNVTMEGITKDLEWMKAVGIAGFQLADVAFGMGQEIDEKRFFMSPEWLDAVRHAAEEADRLSLEMSMFSSAGWSLTGGPWVKPEQAMKKAVWSRTAVSGPGRVHDTLPVPPSNIGPIRDLNRGGRPGPSAAFYRDQLVVAFPTPPDAQGDAALKPGSAGRPVHGGDQGHGDQPARSGDPVIITSAGPMDTSPLTDQSLNTSVTLPGTADQSPAWIQFSYERPVTVRSFSIASRQGIPFGRVLASEDGISFRTLVTLPGTQNYRPGTVRTYSVPETTAPVFRLEMSGAPPQPAEVMAETPPAYPEAFTLSECKFHSLARIHRWEDKAGFSLQFEYGSTPTPEASPGSIVPGDRVIDLTGHMDENGVLDWNVPEGDWTILRMGYSLTGAQNRPAVAAGLGYEVDKLNEDHTRAYLEGYFGPLEEKLGPLVGNPLQYLMLDSWEAGMQNWTDDMVEEFRERRGYDPVPFLPALAGYIVSGSEKSDRFLWDFRRTLADMFAENHYGTVTRFAHEKGMGTYSEATGVSLEVMEDALLSKKMVDIPMGEFWVRDLHPFPMYHVDVRGAASASHVYNKGLVAAESFTGGNFESPSTLKRVGDYWMTQGVNRFVFHTSAHQPLDTKPGNTMVGTHLHRNITWAHLARPFMDYLSRCTFLLQQGHFVADIAYLLDEGAPSTMPFWGDGLTPAPPPGHDYDYLNADALLHLAETDDQGNLVLPGGAAYKVLVLPPRSVRMSSGVLEKLRDLVHSGATILGPPPEGPAGLSGYPENEPGAGELIHELWGDLDGIGRTRRYVERGMVVWGISLPSLLEEKGVTPDVEGTFSQEQVTWIHRHWNGTDIYFISNRTPEDMAIPLHFRVKDGRPEYWDPGTGQITPAAWSANETGVTVPVRLPEYGSVFVVFHPATSGGLGGGEPPGGRQPNEWIRSGRSSGLHPPCLHPPGLHPPVRRTGNR